MTSRTLRLVAPALVLGGALACLRSPRLVTLSQPQAAAQAHPDVKALLAAHPGRPGIFLESRTTYEHAIDDQGWHYFETQDLAYVIFNPEADWLTTFRARSGPGYELERAIMSVEDPDTGAVARFTDADLKSTANSDGSRSYKFIYPNIKKGTIIREAYVLRKAHAGQGVSFRYDMGLQFTQPCQALQVQFLYPSWWAVKVKKPRKDLELPLAWSYDEKNSKRTFTYRAKDVPAWKEEPYSPFRKDVSLYAEWQISHLEAMGLQRSSPLNWDAVARAYRLFAIDRDTRYSERVSQTVQEVVKHARTDVERVDAIVTWLQKNLKLTRRHPGTFAAMLDLRQGDGPMITGLCMDMLKKVNIPSTFILIHTSDDGWLDPDFVEYDQFSVPAVKTRVDGKDYVLFPYRPLMPMDLVPEPYVGQQALSIAADGSHAFVEVPAGNVAHNDLKESYKVTFQEDGRVKVREERVYEGTLAYAQRVAFQDKSRDEVAQSLRKSLSYGEGQVKLEDHAVENLDDIHKPLRVVLTYTLDNLVTLAPEEAIFQTGGLFAPSSGARDKEDPADRVNPVCIRFDMALVKEITLAFPASWTLVAPPAPVKVENRFGSLVSEVRPGTSELSVTQRVTLKRSLQPKETYGELLALTGARSTVSMPSLVFKIRN